jgi:hypothetical protein
VDRAGIHAIAGGPPISTRVSAGRVRSTYEFITSPFQQPEEGATLILAEQGDLLLNDPVGNYLPDLKDMKVVTAKGLEPARRQPALQEMLRHTAGVSYGNRGDTPLHNQSGADFLKELGQLPLHFQPGTAWEYSHGLDLAGLSGGSCDQETARRILGREAVRPSWHEGHGIRRAGLEGGAHCEAVAHGPGHWEADRVPRARVTPWQYDCGGGCASGTALDYAECERGGRRAAGKELGGKSLAIQSASRSDAACRCPSEFLEQRLTLAWQ